MAVITWGVIGLIIGLVGGAIGPGRGELKWLPGVLVGVCIALFTGWLGGLTFQVDMNNAFEPISAICAAAGAIISVGWWLLAKFRYRERALHPERHLPKPLPEPRNAPM
jgi:uncharacterized membrane protein YeaQ/YmgE (transglycosylase-associated protein family)